jgi:preprotein translocase subunit SecG
LATAGFVSGSPGPIVLAALLALPASIVAVPCYYVVYGLLALVTGANSSSSSGSGSGSGSASAGGTSTTVTADDTATWFAVTTHVLGVLALVVAAALNVLLVQAVLSRRRGRRAPVA